MAETVKTVLKEALTEKDYQVGVELFKEYASQIGVDLAFQNFKQEIRDIKKQYARPDGILIIAYHSDGNPLGCFGIRKLVDSICELKRMYLRNEARGHGLGKQMLMKSIQLGQELGYLKMRLDTLPTMSAARGLYKKFGFYEIEPYRYNPVDGTKYLEILFPLG